MAHPLVTFPWIDREEVKHVFAELYSNELCQQRHAVGRISVWEARSLSRLPLAAEITSALVKANIEYETADKPVGNNASLREQYSMAVIRFVNLFTERNQQTTHALPVHVVASRLGVPAWIVDLRHAATHATLPSLAELRAAASWSMQWLKTEFWEVQCWAPFEAFELKMSARQDVRDHLVTYMQRKYSKSSVGYKSLLGKLEILFNDLGSEVCPILTEDGYLVFTEEQLISIELTNDDILKCHNKHLPVAVVEFWRPVLQLLLKCDLMSSLLLHIVSSVSDITTFRNAFLSKWVMTILSNFDTTKSREDLSNTSIAYKTLIRNCFGIKQLSGCCTNLLIQRASLSGEQEEMLRNLNLVYGNGQTMKKADRDECTLSVDNVDVSQIAENQVWKLCPERIDWSKMPIGLLPDQTIDYTSLEIGDTFRDVSVNGTYSKCTDNGDSIEDNTFGIKELDSETDFQLPMERLKTPWSSDTLKSISDQITLF